MYVCPQVRLNHIHHDFPFLSRYLYFPTLLHPFRSLKPSNFDMVLKLFLIIGCVNGMMVMFGVGYTKVSLFICWTIYLSFTNTVQLLIYPWYAPDTHTATRFRTTTCNMRVLTLDSSSSHSHSLSSFSKGLSSSRSRFHQYVSPQFTLPLHGGYQSSRTTLTIINTLS